jgi:diguanylate cyclase (GGDEF)-like protein
LVALLLKRHHQWECIASARPGRGFVDSIFSAQREGQVVSDVIQKIGNSLDLNETFAELMPALSTLMRFDTLIIWAERDGQLIGEYVDGAHVALCSSLSIPHGGGVSGWVAANGKPIPNGDASFEMAQAGKDPDMCPFNYALSVPLEGGGVRGALTLYRILERRFTAEEARLLTAVAPKLSVAMANGLKYRDASQQAVTDALTGLPNAGALFRRLERAAPAALLVCDLDGFKQVNDNLGHLTGNRLLQALADGFRRSCRGDDFVARMGGDEFVLLIEHITPDEIGNRIAQFREMVRATGRQVCGQDILDASFGAAFHPADGSTPQQLLAFADQQMYRRKHEQKAGVLLLEQRKVTA